jgi:cyclophilin family peptidyl-prolyl cis-trans isomerase/protein-disulfide isomerase
MSEARWLRWPPLVGLAFVVLTACAGQGAASTLSPGPLPSPITLPTAAILPFPTAFPTHTPQALTPELPQLPPEQSGNSPLPLGEGTGVRESTTPTPTFIPFPFEIGPDELVRGPDDAPVTIIQYGDFHGRYDALFEPDLRRVLEENPDEVRLVWRPFPLVDVNDKAYYAAVAAEAARRQGKFWEMHDLLFDTYLDWATLPPEDFWAKLDEFADELDLDDEQLAEDLTTGGAMQAVLDDYETARAAGVPGTPALILNRTPYTGPLEYSVLNTTVQLELLKTRQYEQYPDTVIDARRAYSAILHTEKGDITIELHTRQAPVAVNSFVFLAREGWYDDNPFYRVLPGEAVFTGDPSGTGLGGPGYLYADEIDPSLKFDQPGVVALNNAGANTNGSQFFITFGPMPQLDGQYTIIGQVTDGLSVLSRLAPRDPQADPDPPPADLLESVTIVEG